RLRRLRCVECLGELGKELLKHGFDLGRNSLLGRRDAFVIFDSAVCRCPLSSGCLVTSVAAEETQVTKRRVERPIHKVFERERMAKIPCARFEEHPARDGRIVVVFSALWRSCITSTSRRMVPASEFKPPLQVFDELNDILLLAVKRIGGDGV